MNKNASVIAITSGKGGVGKTHISANLGILLAKQSRRTCIIDADHGLANINLILGLPACKKPQDLFSDNFDPSKAVIHSDLGVDILPSASGISKDVDFSEPTKAQITQLIEKLRPLYDVIIVDTAAGISDNVKYYLELADHVLLAINSEPTSLTDAFGLIRKMKPVQPFYNVIINRVSNAAAATSVYKRFAGAVRKYIGAQLGAIGYISEDSFVSAAVLSQTAVVNYSPNCLATQCLKRIARTLSRKLVEDAANKPIQPKESIESTVEVDLKSAPKSENSNETRIPMLAEKIIEAMPEKPSFIAADEEVEPFHAWLSQLEQFFDKENNTEKTRSYRKRKLTQKLEKLCDQDAELLADLETLVVNSSVKNSESILEQTNIANRLAKTRFVEEPVFDTGTRKSLIGDSFNNQGVNKAFSIISKFK